MTCKTQQVYVGNVCVYCDGEDMLSPYYVMGDFGQPILFDWHKVERYWYGCDANDVGKPIEGH